MAVKVYTKDNFFPAAVVTGAGLAGGVANAGVPVGIPTPADSGEFNHIIFHLAEFIRESVDIEKAVVAMGAVYDKNDQNQFYNLLATNLGQCCKLATGAIPPAPAEFVAPVLAIIDPLTGKTYTKKTDGTVAASGGGEVINKTGAATIADFAGGAIIVVDDTPLTGGAWMQQNDGAIVKVGGSTASAKAGVPISTDFVPPVTTIQDTTTGAIYSIRADGKVVSNMNKNVSFAGAPTITDDFNSSYTVGDTWTDTSIVPNRTYVNTDNTVGAAVWSDITKDGSPLQVYLMYRDEGTFSTIQPSVDIKIDYELFLDVAHVEPGKVYTDPAVQFNADGTATILKNGHFALSQSMDGYIYGDAADYDINYQRVMFLNGARVVRYVVATTVTANSKIIGFAGSAYVTKYLRVGDILSGGLKNKNNAPVGTDLFIHETNAHTYTTITFLGD